MPFAPHFSILHCRLHIPISIECKERSKLAREPVQNGAGDEIGSVMLHKMCSIGNS